MAAVALELAETLGLDELRASVLNTLAVIRLSEGELEEGRRLMHSAIEVASSGSPEGLRALTNLSVVAVCDGDPVGWLAAHERAAEAAAKAGDRLTTLWLDAASIRGQDYEAGHWDSALTRSTEFIDAAAAAGGHYAERSVYLMRADVLASRGDVEGAARDLEHVVAQFGVNTDSQVVVPAFLLAARVCLLLADDERAVHFVDRALATARARQQRAPGIGAEAVVAIVSTGRADAWNENLATAADTRRVQAGAWYSQGGRSRPQRCTRASEGPTRRPSLASSPRSSSSRRAGVQRPTSSSIAHWPSYRAAGATRVVARAESLLASTA